MSEQKFLKATCQHCGGHIEFPAEGLGMTVQCPHCQTKTVLRVEAPPVPASPRPFTPAPATPAPTLPPAAPKPLTPAPAPASAVAPAPAPATSSAPARPVPPPPSAAGSTIPKPPAPLPSAVPLTSRKAPGERKYKLSLVLATVVGLAVLGAAGYVGYTKFMADKEAGDSAPATAKTSTETPASPAAQPSPQSVAAKVPKSPKDLKTSELILEKSKGGSSLVYAVGTIRNESDHQRFGVKVEVDILDASGKKVGKATDYTQVIEPREEWRFHALVLEDRATAAKIASIKEEE